MSEKKSLGVNALNITAAREVGDISHLTDTLTNLISILYHSKIATSPPDIRKGSNTQRPYVSFSRNMTSAALRNSNKWRYGIIVDGDKLSNRYSLRPHNFQAEKNASDSGVPMKGIRAYDNGTYQLILQIGQPTRIPKWLYDEIKLAMLSQPEDFNIKKGLVHDTRLATKRSNGAYRCEWVYYKSQYGGMLLSPKTLSDKALSYVANHVLNEEETRIFLPKQSVKDNKAQKQALKADRDPDGYIADFSKLSYVDLKGCIIGLVLPKSELDCLYHPPTKEWEVLKEVAYDVLPSNFKISTY